MENKAYPLYQYSVFLDDTRNEQIVIRCDTWKEFLDAKVEINKIFDKRAHKNAFSNPAVTSSNMQQDLGVCKDCGNPNKLSKAGKPYCSNLCWKK